MIREVLKGCWDLIIDSRNILSLVACNDDCLPAVRSHVRSHAEAIDGIFVHTFSGDRANLSSGDFKEVLLQLVAFGLMSDRLCVFFRGFGLY